MASRPVPPRVDLLDLDVALRARLHPTQPDGPRGTVVLPEGSLQNPHTPFLSFGLRRRSH